MGDTVSDIKNRLSIEDVVASYVQLKKAGRSFKGLCPFHSEKTPSFIVSPEKQIAYCFGCHKGGDMFKFIQEVEGVDFPEAIRILADKAGIKVDVKKFKSKEKGEKSLNDRLIELHEDACRFFESNLFDKNDDAKEVLVYLEKRGITKDTIEEFKIGFATGEYDGLYKYLIKKGYKHDLLIKSGLFTLKDVAGKGIYDKFRWRLMFPISDYMGRAIAFGGRALKQDQVPKYLNSPETAIYSKGKVLYGLSHAKQSIKEADKVIVVEGYFDVISLHQSGIKNVVASSGTALTHEQVRLIKRFTKDIVSCFDTDNAGVDATKRAYEVVQDAEMDMKTLRMPASVKDPADLMLERGEKGKEEFLKLIDSAEYFLEFYITLMNTKFNVKTLEGRKKFLDELLPLVKSLKSSVKTDHYVRILSKYLGIKEKFLYDEIDNFKVLRDQFGQNKSKEVFRPERFDSSTVLISILLEYPQYFERVKEPLNEGDFVGELKDIYIELSRQYNDARTEKKKWDLEGEKMAGVSEKMALLSLYAEENYSQFGEESIVKEVGKLIDNIVKSRRMHQRIVLEKALKEAEESGDEGKRKQLLEEFQVLITSQ